jgi:hypothetical protein
VCQMSNIAAAPKSKRASIIRATRLRDSGKDTPLRSARVVYKPVARLAAPQMRSAAMSALSPFRAALLICSAAKSSH